MMTLTAEQFAEREEAIRQIALRHDASMTPEQKLRRRLRIKQGGAGVALPAVETETNIKKELASVAIAGDIPVSPSEVLETLKEDVDAFREEQKDAETAGEALTADEKV